MVFVIIVLYYKSVTQNIERVSSCKKSNPKKKEIFKKCSKLIVRYYIRVYYSKTVKVREKFLKNE